LLKELISAPASVLKNEFFFYIQIVIIVGVLNGAIRSVCRGNSWLVSNSETVNVKFHWLNAHVTMTLWPLQTDLKRAWPRHEWISIWRHYLFIASLPLGL